MTRRKQTAPPVEIVLTEEELADIIRETTRVDPPSPPVPPPPGPGPVNLGPGFAMAQPFADPAFSLGVRSPGAVGDAIRMILEATTLDRGKRLGGE